MSKSKAKNIGVSMIGGGKKKDDNPHQFHPTPKEATIAFLKQELPAIKEIGINSIWEPSCGEGDIAKILIEHANLDVIATDLIDRGYGQGGECFLFQREKRAKAVITNPPYKEMAELFIRKCFELEIEYVAMLLKSTFYHADTRYPLYIKHPPRRIYPLAWRLDFHDLGNPTMETAWYVWRRSCAIDNNEPQLIPLRHPKHYQEPEDLLL